MGLGLFAGIEYKSGDKICHFRGELIAQDVYDARENHEYGVAMGVLVLDLLDEACCFKYAANAFLERLVASSGQQRLRKANN